MSHDDRSRLKLRICFMGPASGESASDFQAWLNANELHAPKDFKFAFTSAHKAAEACPVAPQAASNAWTSISHSEVEVPSSWALWIKSHHDAKGRVSAKPQDSKPTFKIWRGLQHRKHRKDQGPANDSHTAPNRCKRCHPYRTIVEGAWSLSS